jgi:hypothetical protein
VLLIGFIERPFFMTETSSGDTGSRSGLISLDSPDFFVPDMQTGTGPLLIGRLQARGWPGKKFFANSPRYGQGMGSAILGRPKSVTSLQKGGCCARDLGA